MTRLQIDGEEWDFTTLNEGWHDLEQRTGSARRWTTGSTPLPAGARLMVVDLVGESLYCIERRETWWRCWPKGALTAPYNRVAKEDPGSGICSVSEPDHMPGDERP